MIFKTFDSDVDNISSKWGIFGKSFNDISTDIEKRWSNVSKTLQVTNDYTLENITKAWKMGNTNPITFLADDEVTSILDKYNRALDSGAEATAKFLNSGTGNKFMDGFLKDLDGAPATMNKYNVATKNATKQQKAFSLSTITTKAAVLALNAAVSMGLSIALSALIKTINDVVQSEENLKDVAKELGSELTDNTSSIESYKNKIKELKNVLDNNSSSIEDVTQARIDLMAIQDELIEKFGTEKGAIENITEAINGQSDALDNLSKQSYYSAKNKFNEKTNGNKFKDWLTYGSTDNDKIQSNMDKMVGQMRYSIYSLETTGNEVLDNLIAKSYGLSINKDIYGEGSHFIISGRLDEIQEKLYEIQELASDFDVSTVFENSFTKISNDVDSLLTANKDLYEQYILWEKILTNDPKNQYDEQYNLINQYKEAYNEALKTNDSEAIEKASNNYAEILSSAINMAIANGDTDVASYFEDMYPEMQQLFAEWKFKLNFEPNTNDLKDKVSDALTGLEGFSSEEILGFNAKVATQEQVDSYAVLNNVASEYGLTLKGLINLLLKMGLIQSESYQQLVDQFGQDSVNTLSDEDLTYAYSIENVGDMSFEELQTEIQRLKDEANTTEYIDFSDIFNADSIDDTKQKLLDLATSGELSAETIESTEEYKELLDQTAMSAQEFVDAIERFNIDNLNASFEKYSEVLQKVRNGQTLSAEEIASLIVENEELADAVIITGNAYSLEEDALTSLINKYIETSNVAISNQINQTRKTIELIKERIKAYGIEENAINKYGIKIGNVIDNLTRIWEVSGGSETAIGQYLYDNFGMDATSMTPQIIAMIESNAELNELLKELEESFNNGSEYSGSSSSSKTFDWIETLISRIQTRISNLAKTVSATYLTWTERNNELTKQMSAVNEEIVAQGKAYEKYMSKASEVAKKLNAKDKSLVSKIQNGDYSIKDYSGETAELIQEYEDLYNKAIAASQAVKDLKADLTDTAKTKFDNTISQYDDILSNNQGEADRLNALIEQAETDGHIVGESYYQALLDVENMNKSTLQNELKALQEAFNYAMSNGNIQEGSEDWYDMVGQIQDVEQAIIESNTALIELNNSIRDLEWESFDNLLEKISQITEETDFLIDLMSNEDMFENDGSITEYGQATLGLHAVNYQTYIEQSKKYAEELLDIEKAIAEESSDQELIARREELLELQRESIFSAQEQIDAIVELRKEGFDTLLDSLDEVIEKYNELQDAERSLYDYEKTVSEQVAEVDKYQKIIDSLQGMKDTEQGKSMLQKYEVKLQEAKENLEQTQMDRNIEEREKLLDSIYD